jgi:hypothetical protein
LRADHTGYCDSGGEEPIRGIDQDDLSRLFEMGAQLGETLTPPIVALLDGPPTCYGKAALVGSAGAMEHGGAMLHHIHNYFSLK